MYDRSNAGKNLRKYCGVSLAWWHTYKWATKKIMQVFAIDYIAPLFHHIFPTRKFNPDKSSLPSNATFLTMIRLAYPHFRQQLDNVLLIRSINPRQRILLQNLKDLCQCFIPVVILYIHINLGV